MSAIICPGGGNFPKKGEKLDDFLKMLVDYYNQAAKDAAKYGCKVVGLHNHTGEFNLKMADGTTYWDYFFRNTDPAVCMEQDVGWTTCAGHDPKEGTVPDSILQILQNVLTALRRQRYGAAAPFVLWGVEAKFKSSSTEVQLKLNFGL